MKTMRQGATAEKRFLSFPYSLWALIACDLFVLVVSFVCAYCLRLRFPGALSVETYLPIVPGILVFPLIYAAMRLYSAGLTHPAEELKMLSRGTSLGFVLLAGSFFLLKNADAFSRAFFLGAWILVLCFVPLGRHMLRCFCCKRAWWQTPVIFIGRPETIATLSAVLRQKHPSMMSLKPVALVLVDDSGQNAPLPGQCDDLAFPCERRVLIPSKTVSYTALFDDLAGRHPDAVIAVSLSGLSKHGQERLLEAAGKAFYRLLLLPDYSWSYCIPSQIAYIGGSFALNVRRNLCDRRRLRVKRASDLMLGSLFFLFALPFFVFFALLITLDSPGPIFYRQKRIGRGGKPFFIRKFRTMQKDADAALKEYLRARPEEAKEWEATHKLRYDPRITRMGRFLRKCSMDELPQIINVLRGEMSLVGPRPIVEDEIQKYGGVFDLYVRVLPGITGLWQVSGRNDTTYEERVALDRSYIANWSVWLDWYILARTVPEVLGMRGAY